MDITALVVNVSDTRKHVTPYGPRLITDVTIRGVSGPSGASECQFTMFFPDSSSGNAALKNFCTCQLEKVPVAFFNLCIQGSVAPKTLKPHYEDFHWAAARTGTRAAELTSQVEVLQSTNQATCIAKIPEHVAYAALGYVAIAATITVTKLLQKNIRSHDEFTNGEKLTFPG